MMRNNKAGRPGSLRLLGIGVQTRRRRLSFLIAVLAGIAAGCSKQAAVEAGKSAAAAADTADTAAAAESNGTPETAAWPRTLTDAAGHNVVLEKKPERIALLHTFYLEHFLLLDAPPIATAMGNALGQVEALEQSEMYAPFLNGLDMINLGSAADLNLEAVLASAPDVIVSFAAGGWLDKVYDQLVQIAPVVLLNSSATWNEQLAECAQIVGKEDDVQSIVTEITAVIDAAKEAIAAHSDRTLAVFRTDGKVFINQGASKYYQVFGIARPTGFPAVYENASLEAVVEMNPYYIVFQHNYAAASAFAEGFGSSSVWQSIEAVKNGHIYYFDENMNTYGPLAMRLGAEKLAQIYSSEP